MNKQVVEPVTPDPVTLWMHNHNGFLLGGLLYLVVAIPFWLTGHTLLALASALVGIFMLTLRPFVCGWVHTFAAYHLDNTDLEVTVRQWMRDQQ